MPEKLTQSIEIELAISIKNRCYEEVLCAWLKSI